MSQVNIRIDQQANDRLGKMAEYTHRSKGGMIAWMIDRYWEKFDFSDEEQADNIQKEAQSDIAYIEQP